jgi:hypothetical protein
MHLAVYHDHGDLGCSVYAYSLVSAVSFDAIFDLRLLDRLPLNVRGIVSTTTFKRHDVIDDVALPPFQVAGLPREVGPCRSAALDLEIHETFGRSREQSA